MGDADKARPNRRITVPTGRRQTSPLAVAAAVAHGRAQRANTDGRVGPPFATWISFREGHRPNRAPAGGFYCDTIAASSNGTDDAGGTTPTVLSSMPASDKSW